MEITLIRWSFLDLKAFHYDDAGRVPLSLHRDKWHCIQCKVTYCGITDRKETNTGPMFTLLMRNRKMSSFPFDHMHIKLEVECIKVDTIGLCLHSSEIYFPLYMALKVESLPISPAQNFPGTTSYVLRLTTLR